MKVQVTQQHIDAARQAIANPKPGDSQNRICPVAQAIKAHLGQEVVVFPSAVYSASGMEKLFTLPNMAHQFILDFDQELAVEPFEFDTLSAVCSTKEWNSQ